MTVWVIAAGTLMIVGFGTAMVLAYRGTGAARLLGLALGGSVGVLVMLLLCQAFGQASYLIVPIVLAVLSFVGTLVFTRLLDVADD